MDEDQVKNIRKVIEEIAKHPNKKLSIDSQGTLIATDKSPDKKTISNLKKFIESNKSNIQKAFNEAYNEDIDCIPFATQATKANKGLDLTINCTKSWMQNLDEETKKKPLRDLVLPGTHDSGASKVDFNKTPAWLDKNWQKILFKIVGKLPIVNKIIKNWVVTQECSLDKQLESGVRLLDLRLAKDDKGELYTGHTLLLDKFDESLDKIAKFLKDNPGEIVVINLKTDHQFQNNINDEDKHKALGLIQEKLGDLMKETSVNNSVEDLVKTNNRAIVFVDDPIRTIGTMEEQKSIKSGDQARELWPNEAVDNNVVGKIKGQIAQQEKGEKYVYASLNTTPDAPSIVRDTMHWRSLITNGRDIQKKHGNELLTELTGSNKGNVSGIILDSPTHKMMQKIIMLNREKDKNAPNMNR